MTLVNLDGTAIFGAGFEWFWSMAQFLLVAASILGIYFQLRAQRASNLYGQSAGNVGDFFERLGYLVAHKHLRAADVCHSMRLSIGPWWAFMGPYLERTREQIDDPGLYEWFEKLELEMQRLDREAGFTNTNPFTMRGAADDLGRQLRLLADARNGIFPTRKPDPISVAEA